jgi:hypothetical protein
MTLNSNHETKTLLPAEVYEKIMNQQTQQTQQTQQEQTQICDICNSTIDINSKNEEDGLCTLYLQGITEKISCHARCIRVYYSCKGDFSILPEGRLKRSIYKAINESSTVMIKNTGITIRDKQARYIISGLQISQEEGYKRVNSLAINFYDLPKPSAENMEFYSIDDKKQIVLLRKVEKEEKADDDFDIIETSRT